MKKILLLIALIALLACVHAEQSYLLELKYSKGEIELNSIHVAITPADKSEEENEFTHKAVVYGKENEILSEQFYLIPNQVLTDALDEEGFSGEIIEFEEVEFSLALRFHEEGERIELFDENKVRKLELDVAVFSNNFVEPAEEIEPIKTPEIQPTETNPKTPEQKKPTQDNLPIALASGGLGFVMVGFVLVQYWKERNREF